jgi:murein L,D-transpeptidase YafK
MLLALLFAALLATPLSATPQQKADLIVVKKSASRLYLQSKGVAFASFNVAFGANPKGHKQQEGDERTPEGTYAIDWKHAASGYYKALHVSYPNARDVASAKTKGINPGGAIMIHGQKNGWGWIAPITQLFDWTNGCIALSNRDMDVVWNAVDPGTRIHIAP